MFQPIEDFADVDASFRSGWFGNLSSSVDGASKVAGVAGLANVRA